MNGHQAFASLALAQDIKWQRELIALYEGHLAQSQTEEARAYLQRALKGFRENLATLRKINPVNY